LKSILFISFGGGLGSVLRYLMGLFMNKFFSYSFVSTLVINVLGCLLIGLFFGYFEKQNNFSTDLKLFLITGFCGGFTTFSTFSQENLQLLQSNHTTLAFVSIGSSLILGLLATWFGLYLIKLT
jgi:fluoride exporter